MSGCGEIPRLEIIRVGQRHAEDLADLHARLFEDPWDGEGFVELLRQPGAKAFIARVADPPEAAGFILGRVAAGNGAALSFYARRGFRACGRRASYYRRAGRPAEDALVLSLAL